MLATYRSYGGCLTVFGAVCWQPTGLMGAYGGCWTVFGAVCWQPTGLMGVVGPRLGLYVGNLQVLWGFGVVCWQPTGLMGVVGPSLGLYVGNLQVLWGLFDRLWGCMLATYRSYGGCWTAFRAVCWQPTGLMGVVGPSLGLYVGNLQVLWGLLDRLWGCMLATYRSYGGCLTVFGAVCWQPTSLWTVFGAVCWQPTGLMGVV